MKQLLFIFGCPRSGTTALWKLLSNHYEIALGLERYALNLWNSELTSRDYEAECFLNVQSEDTFYSSVDEMKKLIQSGELDDIESKYPNATVIGDKIPLLFHRFEHMKSQFPDAKYIHIIRNPLDVCASFQRRFENAADTTWLEGDWHNAIVARNSAIQETEIAKAALQIYEVNFEEVFSDKNIAKKLLHFIGVDWHQGFDDHWVQNNVSVNAWTRGGSGFFSKEIESEIKRQSI